MHRVAADPVHTGTRDRGLIISVLEEVEVEVEMEGKIDLAADLYMPGTRVG